MTSRCGRLLLSASADVRSSDDVIAFARLVGEAINEGIYHEMIHTKGITFLSDMPVANTVHRPLSNRRTILPTMLMECLPPPVDPLLARFAYARFDLDIDDVVRCTLYAVRSCRPFNRLAGIEVKQIMDTPVKSLKELERRDVIEKLLDSVKHNGFPVLATIGNHNAHLCGVVRRSDLHKLLKAADTEPDTEIDVLSGGSKVVHSVLQEAPVVQAFTMFRALGLRHLIVTDKRRSVVGIITRRTLMRLGHAHNRKPLYDLPDGALENVGIDFEDDDVPMLDGSGDGSVGHGGGGGGGGGRRVARRTTSMPVSQSQLEAMGDNAGVRSRSGGSNANLFDGSAGAAAERSRRGSVNA